VQENVRTLVFGREELEVKAVKLAQCQFSQRVKNVG